jgi:hypothetical protein
MNLYIFEAFHCLGRSAFITSLRMTLAISFVTVTVISFGLSLDFFDFLG